MKVQVVLILCIYLCNAQEYEFPEGFIFGVGTASYQIEGAWNESDKGENIWDYLTHNYPEFVMDSSNGDVASDGYHKLDEDIQLMKNVGVDFYRFSLSWSRILPTGHINKVSDDGVRYYDELIDKLLANDILPYVTIFHWDLPQPLLEIGGWPNPALADIFANYADLVFRLFGDRVKNWITINEPYQICEEGFSEGILAPGYAQHGIGGYLCGHTVLLAHAKAFKIYNDKYREEQDGRVGIVVHGAWAEPSSESEEDKSAAETWQQMNFGWFLHPIYSESGDYPSIMKERIEDLSELEGFPRSRLPVFSQEEIELLKDSSDFLGLNHYGSFLCKPLEESQIIPSHENDIGSECYLSDDWEPSASPWFSVTPWGLRNILNWIKEEYGNPEVIITESGFTDSSNDTRDCGRVNYYNTYLESLLEAIHEDECNVSGYTAWSIIDLFEWQFGYTYRFGMHYVDFDDPDRPRTAKMSSYIYKNIIETRKVDLSYAPEEFEKCGASVLIGTAVNKLLIGVFGILFIRMRYF